MPSKRTAPKKRSRPATPPEKTKQGTPSWLSFDRILVYALAFVLFAVPLFILPTISEYGYGKTMVLLVAVSVLSILWGLAAWQKGEWKIRIPWITFAFLGFVVASLLSLLAAVNGRVVIQSLTLVVFFFQLLLIIANVSREKRDVTVLLGAIVASAFLASLYALLQYLGVMEGAAGESGINRIISTLGNRNFLGGFLGYLLLPSFILVLRPLSRTVRGVALVVIAFNFGTLMLVEQVAPIIGLVVAGAIVLVGIAVFRPIEPIRKNRRWLIGLLALLVLTFLVEAPSGPLNSVVGLSQDEIGWAQQIWLDNGGRTRELDWWIGLEMLKAHPMTGVGLGNYKLSFLPYKAAFHETPRGSAYLDLSVARAAQAHNDYVQVAAELGILGLLALVAFAGILAYSIWRQLRRNSDEGDQLDLLLLLGGLVVFLVHALVSFPAHLPVSSLAIVLFIGLFHSPAYGEEATSTFRWKKTGTGIALAAVTVLGVVASAFAISDLHANMLMQQGILELQIGSAAVAKETLTRSIACDFAPRQTYYYLATANVRLGELEEAIENYEKCFTRFVDNNVYLVYAEVAMNLGRIEEARQAIEFLLSTHPSREIEQRARYIKANIAIHLRDYAGAARLLEDLAEDAPDFELAFIALGNLYQAREMYEEARGFYDRALKLIDRKLAKYATLEGTRVTAAESGQINQSIASLRSEREYVLEQLAEFPDAE